MPGSGHKGGKKGRRVGGERMSHSVLPKNQKTFLPWGTSDLGAISPGGGGFYVTIYLFLLSATVGSTQLSLFNIVYKRNRYICCTRIVQSTEQYNIIYIAVQSETILTANLTLISGFLTDKQISTGG